MGRLIHKVKELNDEFKPMAPISNRYHLEDFQEMLKDLKGGLDSLGAPPCQQTRSRSAFLVENGRKLHDQMGDDLARHRWDEQMAKEEFVKTMRTITIESLRSAILLCAPSAVASTPGSASRPRTDDAFPRLPMQAKNYEIQARIEETNAAIEKRNRMPTVSTPFDDPDLVAAEEFVCVASRALYSKISSTWSFGMGWPTRWTPKRSVPTLRSARASLPNKSSSQDSVQHRLEDFEEFCQRTHAILRAATLD